MRWGPGKNFDKERRLRERRFYDSTSRVVTTFVMSRKWPKVIYSAKYLLKIKVKADNFPCLFSSGATVVLARY